MATAIDLDLRTLDEHEEACVFPQFNANVAWEVGQMLRQRAQLHDKPVAIQILRDNGQLFFHALSKPGTSIDNQKWIERKTNTVLRFGRSSFYMGCKSRLDGKPMSAFFIDEKDYAFHGGGFPVRVRGMEGVVGVIIVSGLRQDQDHSLIVETLKEYLQS